MTAALLLALATLGSVSSDTAFKDNADILYCFVKRAPTRDGKLISPGDGVYDLLGVQFERQPFRARLHDPHALFSGNVISKIESIKGSAILLTAKRPDGGDITLTLALEGAKDGSFYSSIGSNFADGKADNKAPFMAGDCKWFTLGSGSNLLFSTIQKDQPTLLRGSK